MPTVKHIRKVRPNILANWLEAETSELDYRHFPTERGTFLMRKARVQRDKRGVVGVVTIEGREVVPVGRQARELAIKTPVWLPFVCIRLELCPLDDLRTEITTTVKDEPAIAAYSMELLAGIEERWPAETQTEI